MARASGSGARPRAAPPPLVHLPADQAAHPSVSNEWWYVVGHLTSGKHTFGYETTGFGLRHVRPPGARAGSAPVTLYRTDIAITDESGNRFHQRVTYFFPQSAHISSKTLDVRIGSLHLQGDTPAHMSDRASLPGGALQLQLSSRRPPMYVGGRGYISFDGGYTYYYSLTDLATSGTLRLGDKTYPVTGISWLDHQWGDWSWSGKGGWTWMALQLSNGAQLSVFDVHGRGKHYRAASVLFQDGRLRTLPGTTVAALHTWRSPHTDTTYPSTWTVSIPQLRARLTVTPTVRDQELISPGQPAGTYWEGSGRVTGSFQGAAVRGYSYTELVGYARR